MPGFSYPEEGDCEEKFRKEGNLCPRTGTLRGRVEGIQVEPEEGEEGCSEQK